jgi:hypothetical protein
MPDQQPEIGLKGMKLIRGAAIAITGVIQLRDSKSLFGSEERTANY